MQLWLHTYRPPQLLQDCLLRLLREKTAFRMLRKMFKSQEMQDSAREAETRLWDCSSGQLGGKGGRDGDQHVAGGICVLSPGAGQALLPLCK